MSEFRLYFGKNEDTLHQHLKAQPKPGRYLKGLIRNDMTNPQDLYKRFFGDIEADYGTMKVFLQECGIEAVRGRLNSCEGKQREALREILKARHKELRDL